MPTATLAYNPSAGTGRHSHKRLIALLEKSGYRVRFLSTKGADLPAAFRRPGDLVVAAGGDGTVAKVARALRSSHVPMAVLPLGTANNIARSTEARGSASRLIAGWRRDRCHRYDLVSVEGLDEPFTMVESLGVGGFAAAALALNAAGDSGRQPREALHRARLAMARALAEAEPVAGLRVDGVRLRGVFFLEVLNVPLMGPRLRLCREADFSDGRLNVVYGEEKHRKALVEWLEDGAPERQTPPLGSLEAATGLELAWKGAVLRVDDMFFAASEKKRRLTLTVEPGSIRIVSSGQAQRRAVGADLRKAMPHIASAAAAAP